MKVHYEGGSSISRLKSMKSESHQNEDDVCVPLSISATDTVKYSIYNIQKIRNGTGNIMILVKISVENLIAWRRLASEYTGGDILISLTKVYFSKRMSLFGYHLLVAKTNVVSEEEANFLKYLHLH